MVMRTRLKMHGADVTGVAILTAASAIAVVVAMQDLPVPEKWTIISILGFVLVAVAWLLHSIGGRLVDSIDANTKTVAALVTELHTLTQQNSAFQEASDKRHDEYARERERAVREVKEAIQQARGQSA